MAAAAPKCGGRCPSLHRIHGEALTSVALMIMAAHLQLQHVLIAYLQSAVVRVPPSRHGQAGRGVHISTSATAPPCIVNCGVRNPAAVAFMCAELFMFPAGLLRVMCWCCLPAQPIDR